MFVILRHLSNSGRGLPEEVAVSVQGLLLSKEHLSDVLILTLQQSGLAGHADITVRTCVAEAIALLARIQGDNILLPLMQTFSLAKVVITSCWSFFIY